MTLVEGLDRGAVHEVEKVVAVVVTVVMAVVVVTLCAPPGKGSNTRLLLVCIFMCTYIANIKYTHTRRVLPNALAIIWTKCTYTPYIKV